MYWMTGLLGFALMVAPFLFGYSYNAPALWASLLVGLATVGFSWMEAAVHDRETWEYWSVAALGAIAVIAPFLLGFADLTIALWTSIVLGVLIALFAATKLSMNVGHKTRHVTW